MVPAAPHMIQDLGGCFCDVDCGRSFQVLNKLGITFALCLPCTNVAQYYST